MSLIEGILKMPEADGAFSVFVNADYVKTNVFVPVFLINVVICCLNK